MICILRLLTGKTPSSMSQGCFLLVTNMEIWSWRMGDLSCKVNVQIQKILYQGKWKLQLGIIILMGDISKILLWSPSIMSYTEDLITTPTTHCLSMNMGQTYTIRCSHIDINSKRSWKNFLVLPVGLGSE